MEISSTEELVSRNAVMKLLTQCSVISRVRETFFPEEMLVKVAKSRESHIPDAHFMIEHIFFFTFSKQKNAVQMTVNTGVNEWLAKQKNKQQIDDCNICNISPDVDADFFLNKCFVHICCIGAEEKICMLIPSEGNQKVCEQMLEISIMFWDW